MEQVGRLEHDLDLDLELRPHRRPSLAPPAAFDASAQAAMLLHLAGFLRGVGVFMQRQGEPAPANPAQQQKYTDAKAALIAELQRLLDGIADDARLSLKARVEKGRQIGEAIGMLRVCSLEGMNRAVLAVGMLIAEVPSEQTDAWRTMFAWTCLATAKKAWDDRPPRPDQPADSRRVEYDAVRGAIIVWAGGVEVSAFVVDASKADEARRKAQELQQIYTRCDYPDKGFAEAVAALKRP